ncbi:MAG: zinc ribbon domain-containing protein [Planctomycetota bacterium]|nr:zinc ribbon domain-containing protein [Planctomycetota bacterium]
MTDERRSNPGLWILAILAFSVFILWNIFFDFGWGWRGSRRWMHLPWFGPINSLFGIYAVISVGLAVWVGVDANRRGNNGWLWGGLTFVTGIVGLLVYLLLEKDVKIARRGIDDVPGASGTGGVAGAAVAAARPGPAPPGAGVPAEGACGGCGAGVRSEYKHCPYCGGSLARRCVRCGHELELGWRACPECGAPAERSSSAPDDPAPGV